MKKTSRTEKRGNVESVSRLSRRLQNAKTDEIPLAAHEKLASVENALRERVKELGCLYGIAQLLERYENSLDRFCKGLPISFPCLAVPRGNMRQNYVRRKVLPDRRLQGNTLQAVFRHYDEREEGWRG